MIRSLGQVMVYVKNQDQAKDFWVEKAGFTVIAEEDNKQGMRWIEVAPEGEEQVSCFIIKTSLLKWNLN